MSGLNGQGEDYRAFVSQKAAVAQLEGIEVSEAEIHPFLKPHQRAIVRWACSGGRRAIFANFGLGKCHGRGTPILMADGTIKAVEDVVLDDRLMGDDGAPRTVLSLASGREPMYRVTLKNGDTYTCNESHIFSLRLSNRYREHAAGDLVDMPLRDYQSLPVYAKRNCVKHYKVPVDWPEQKVPFDPYVYGTWLGDGSSRTLSWTINDRDPEITAKVREFAAGTGLAVRVVAGRGCHSYHLSRGGRQGRRPISGQYRVVLALIRSSVANGEKRIDRRYLVNSKPVRLALLAGIIDTDGYLVSDGCCFEIATKWSGLRDDIVFLGRSLGLSVSSRPKVVNGATYWVIVLSGHTDIVPCLTRKKAHARRQIKTPLVYGFTVEAIGEGEYFGFCIDGNRRYLLGDFTVTHNTIMQLEIVRLLMQKMGGGRGLIVVPLGIRQEFSRDATKIGQTITFIRRIEEADHDGLYMTNYETVRDAKLDPTGFQVVSLDEASILRGFGGTLTFREFMRRYEGTSLYRFVATATPSPNNYIELLAYAAFLGIMDISEAKTRFFKRDSTKADTLTLLPNRERDFWLWVSSWAILLQRPSDLGAEYSDEGYALPPLDIRWHRLPTDHTQHQFARDDQGLLFRSSSIGVTQAAQEKRLSLTPRVAKVKELLDEDPESHCLLWHDLEAERHALMDAVPDAVDVFGAQDLEERERRVIAFSDGEIKYLATKPVLSGAGCNFQRHCHRAIFTGIGFKFYDVIQAIHRVHRFLQDQPVRIDLIYTEAEDEIRKQLERKWQQHNALVDTMRGIIQEYGLAQSALASALTKSSHVTRRECVGEQFRLVNNDAVDESSHMPSDSAHLILTSIPFSTQYEYTTCQSDFGHNENNEQFWRQMDFLTPHLLRVLAPGRICAIHVKDRITPGGLTGLGFQTLHPFHCEAIYHYQRHGFAFLGMKTIVTDVVRENNQTYRLGWTEQCKDGTRMGCGVPEYLLIFRKPPTDSSNGYADVPVVKGKPLTEQPDGVVVDYDYDAGKIVPNSGYSRARWQLDAHGFSRSNGNRLLTDDELRSLPHAEIYKRWREESQHGVYDFDRHVKVGELMERDKRLPSTFMLLPPHSWHPDVWTDVARMRTLNMMQERKGQQMHLCPLQFDIVDRLIVQHSMEGETVFDPFAGLMTVPYCAVKLGRKGLGIELNAGYFADGVAYVQAAASQVEVPSLFESVEAD